MIQEATFTRTTLVLRQNVYVADTSRRALPRRRASKRPSPPHERLSTDEPYITLYYIILLYATLHHVILYYVTVFYYFDMLCNVILYYVLCVILVYLLLPTLSRGHGQGVRFGLEAAELAAGP